jgi:hypothetical protein
MPPYPQELHGVDTEAPYPQELHGVNTEGRERRSGQERDLMLYMVWIEV